MQYQLKEQSVIYRRCLSAAKYPTFSNDLDWSNNIIIINISYIQIYTSIYTATTHENAPKEVEFHEKYWNIIFFCSPVSIYMRIFVETTEEYYIIINRIHKYKICEYYISSAETTKSFYIYNNVILYDYYYSMSSAPRGIRIQRAIKPRLNTQNGNFGPIMIKRSGTWMHKMVHFITYYTIMMIKYASYLLRSHCWISREIILAWQ